MFVTHPLALLTKTCASRGAKKSTLSASRQISAKVTLEILTILMMGAATVKKQRTPQDSRQKTCSLLKIGSSQLRQIQMTAVVQPSARKTGSRHCAARLRRCKCATELDRRWLSRSSLKARLQWQHPHARSFAKASWAQSVASGNGHPDIVTHLM